MRILYIDCAHTSWCKECALTKLKDYYSPLPGPPTKRPYLGKRISKDIPPYLGYWLQKTPPLKNPTLSKKMGTRMRPPYAFEWKPGHIYLYFAENPIGFGSVVTKK